MRSGVGRRALRRAVGCYADSDRLAPLQPLRIRRPLPSVGLSGEAQLAGGMESFVIRGAGETVFWLPTSRALIPGDRILDTRWRSPAVSRFGPAIPEDTSHSPRRRHRCGRREPPSPRRGARGEPGATRTADTGSAMSAARREHRQATGADRLTARPAADPLAKLHRPANRPPGCDAAAPYP